MRKPGPPAARIPWGRTDNAILEKTRLIVLLAQASALLQQVAEHGNAFLETFHFRVSAVMQFSLLFGFQLVA
jgi:hypothetical protein